MDDVVTAAKIANIHDFIETQDNGYQTRSASGASPFPAGEKQRMCLARAILKNPPI